MQSLKVLMVMVPFSEMFLLFVGTYPVYQNTLRKSLSLAHTEGPAR